jgi:heat shock protein HslJ
MNTKFILTGLAVLVAVAGFVGWMRSAPSTEPVVPENAPIVATFVSSVNEAVTVSFGENTATLNGIGYENLVLPQAIAASGARYEDTEKKIALRNKGNEVTVYRDDTIIFVGTHSAAAPIEEETVGTSTTEAGTDVAEELATGTWVWEKMAMDGKTVAPKKPGVFTLTFTPDGRVSGTTDCNSFGGSYTAEDGTLSFGPLMSTKMYCEGSQEQLYTDVLTRSSHTIVLSEGTLTLSVPGGSTEMLFTKKGE